MSLASLSPPDPMVAEDEPRQTCDGVYASAFKQALPFADPVMSGWVAYSMLIRTKTSHGASAQVLHISNGAGIKGPTGEVFGPLLHLHDPLHRLAGLGQLNDSCALAGPQPARTSRRLSERDDDGEPGSR